MHGVNISTIKSTTVTHGGMRDASEASMYTEQTPTSAAGLFCVIAPNGSFPLVIKF